MPSSSSSSSSYTSSSSSSENENKVDCKTTIRKIFAHYKKPRVSHTIGKTTDKNIIMIETKNTVVKYAKEQIAAKNNIHTYQQLIKNVTTNHGAKSKYKEFKKYNNK